MPKIKNPAKVKAMIFNETTKWKYDCVLDYTDYIDKVGLNGTYIDPIEAAKAALDRSTQNGTSKVRMHALESGWMLVVPKPPNGWPIMARY